MESSIPASEVKVVNEEVELSGPNSESVPFKEEVPFQDLEAVTDEAVPLIKELSPRESLAPQTETTLLVSLRL